MTVNDLANEIREGAKKRGLPIDPIFAPYDVISILCRCPKCGFMLLEEEILEFAQHAVSADHFNTMAACLLSHDHNCQPDPQQISAAVCGTGKSVTRIKDSQPLIAGVKLLDRRPHYD